VQKLVFLANHLKLVQKTGLSNRSLDWYKKLVFLANHLTGAKTSLSSQSLKTGAKTGLSSQSLKTGAKNWSC